MEIFFKRATPFFLDFVCSIGIIHAVNMLVVTAVMWTIGSSSSAVAAPEWDVVATMGAVKFTM